MTHGRLSRPRLSRAEREFAISRREDRLCCPNLLKQMKLRTRLGSLIDQRERICRLWMPLPHYVLTH
jgi:hypothetical protein